MSLSKLWIVLSICRWFNWEYPFEKIVVSQIDYERNPFYGLNQLPSFISPFSDEFYEIKS
jgi:hypothetical protein